MTNSYRLLLAVVLVAVMLPITVIAQDSGGEPLGDIGPYGVPIFVRGGFNDWGLANEMVYDPATEDYKVDILIAAGSWEFKVASEDWSTVDLGDTSDDPVVELGVPKVIGTASFGNLKLNDLAEEVYRFCLDTSTSPDTPTLVVQLLSVPVEHNTWGRIKALYK